MKSNKANLISRLKNMTLLSGGPLFYRLSSKDKTLFAKRLAYLIKAGISILDSLNILKKQAKSRSQKFMLGKITKDVENGQYLSTSLAKFKDAFGDFAINIIKVGETGGILDQNLNYLAEELMKKHELKRKVLGALIYPAFIMAAVLGIIILLITFVLPKIIPVFKSLNTGLPVTTKILILATEFLSSHGLYLLVGSVLLVILFLILKKMVEPFQSAVHKSIIILPLVGNISKTYNMANFCRTFGLLLKSDLPITQAISITADTTENNIYKAEFKKFATYVTKGKKISSEMEKSPSLFPDMIHQMIAIGETTGNLSDTLLYLAQMYESELDELTKNLSNSLEPALMMFMGVLVAFIALSVISPIYEITQSLTK